MLRNRIMISPCFGICNFHSTTRIQCCRIELLLLLELFAELARAIDRLAGTEVVHLEKLADLDFAFLAWVRRGGALGPFDRLFPGLHLNDPVSGDEFFGFGEGAVDDGALGSRELDAGALGTRLEPGAIEEHTGFH